MSPTTTRPRKRKPHASEERPFLTVVTGAAVLAVIGVLVLFAARSPDGAPGLDYTTIYASVPDPGNLQPHNEIRIRGVRVGQVIGVTAESGRALIELQLDPGTEPLPADTAVLLRGKGLLGQRFVELRPGPSERTLAHGDTIRGDADSLTAGVPDALETFDAETRGAMGDMLGELGRGLLGRGTELNDALRVAGPAGEDFRALVHTVLERPGAARRLLPSMELAAGAFDAAREDFAGALDPTARGLQPFVDRREAVESTLEEAPATLATAQSGLERGRRLLAAVTVFSRAARDVLPAAPAGLRETTALLDESPVPLTRTTALLRELDPAVPDVLRVTDELSPVLEPLRRAFDDLHPIITQLAIHGCDIENFADNWRSVLNQGVPGGGPIGPFTAFRVEALGGPESASGFVRPPDGVRVDRESYATPCKYSPGARYDANEAVPSSTGGRVR